MAGISVAIALAAFVAADMPMRDKARADEHVQVLNEASVRRSALESLINDHLQVTSAIGALVAVRGPLPAEEFNSVAKALQRQTPYLRNLGFAVGTVLTQVYPVQGNEAALGLDYRTNAQQWPMVEKAIRTGQSLLVGPVHLVQGGNGLIQRTPVFDAQSQTYVGIVSLVLNSDALFEGAGLHQNDPIRYAVVRITSGRGEAHQRKVLYGDPHLVHDNALSLPIRVPGATWELLAIPASGWGSSFALSIWHVGIEILASLLIGAGVFFLLRHVVRLKLALHRLELRDHQLSEAQRVAQMGHFEWSTTSQTMEWSDQMASILGLPVCSGPGPADMFWRSLHPEDRAEVNALFQKDEEQSGTVSREIRILRPDSEQRWCRLSLEKGRPGPGNAASDLVVGTLIDITDRQSEDRERQKMVQRLHRSNSELQQFAWVASHNLQEPLRLIGSYLQLLERRYGASLDTDAKTFIEYAIRGAKRLQSLIIDLLAYSRLTVEDGPKQEIDLNVLVKDQVALFRTSLAADTFVPTVETLPIVRGWPDQLETVFKHLINNAIQYRNLNCPLMLAISADQMDNMWRIRVVDNGKGIDPLYHEQVFKIFSRLQSDDGSEGTGIGLALCRRIIEHHGGSIWVESDVNCGAAFIFTLPIKVGDDEAE